jgi:NAD(P)H-dependent FMN reductase
MSLAIFNGSPRKTQSNSTLLINYFLNGYYDNSTYNHSIHYLAFATKAREHVEAFVEADTVIIIFPLYTDAMPGQVKFFIESLEGVESKGKKVAFIVQSGFPEAYHATFVEKYLEKLSRKMGWEYLGTLIKGGVEGIQIMPPSMTRELFSDFEKLGSYFARHQCFDPKIAAKMRTPYRFSLTRRIVFRLMMLLGLSDFYWNSKLKQHNAFDKRFDAPYAPDIAVKNA